MNDIIYFSHANGFPASIYRSILKKFEPNYEVRAIKCIGHQPVYAVKGRWDNLADELINKIQNDKAKKVWLLGHSVGGYMSLMAAVKRPDLIRGIILWDAPIIVGWRSLIVKFLQWTGQDIHFSPAKVTKNRRNCWENKEVALTHFQKKPVFALWDKQVLNDYVEYGTCCINSNDKKRYLVFDRNIEYQIYRTLLSHFFAPKTRVPIAYLGGKYSNEAKAWGIKATRRLVGKNFALIDGTHLFPMEKPNETVEATLLLLEKLKQAE